MSLFNLFKKAEVSAPLPSSRNRPITDNSFYSQKKPRLPQNFAQSVMQLQMRLQFVESYDLEAVQQLNQLYKLAIEYYIQIDSKKANHFQRKLASLLMNPQTLDLIEKDQKRQQSEPQGKQIGSQYDKSLKMELNKFNAQSEVMVKSMIEGSDIKQQRNYRLISENISQQESALRKRIEERSRSKSRKKTPQQ